MQKHKNVKTVQWVTVPFLFFLFATGSTNAQDTIIKQINIGLMVGDPIGITIQYPLGNENAWDINFGPDYFGSPRLQIDKIRFFSPFSSPKIKPYAGVGLAVAFAKGTSNMFYSKEPGHESFTRIEDIGFQTGVRTIFGLSINPKNLPFHIFLETGPLFALSHAFEIDFDAAVGIRIKI